MSTHLETAYCWYSHDTYQLARHMFFEDARSRREDLLVQNQLQLYCLYGILPKKFTTEAQIEIGQTRLSSFNPLPQSLTNVKKDG